MVIYKLYIDALFTVSSELEHDIEIEAFGHQEYELLGEHLLNMSDIITVQEETASEAISKAHTLVNEQYATTNHIGYYRIADGSHGYLNVRAMASHISFADSLDEELEEVLEDLNTPYYNLIE